MSLVQMRSSEALIIIMLMLSSLILINSAFGYSRITRVEVSSVTSCKVGEEVTVTADVYTGNNLVEYTHNVVVTLVLPANATIVSGDNPVYIGEMGPGPSHESCQWMIEFQDAGEFIIAVNASCIDTQTIPRWEYNFTNVPVYAPPYVELHYTPTEGIRVNDVVTFDANASSYARGPNSVIVTWSWDFGDGTNITTPVGIVWHNFTKIGNFSISLNATDINGLSSANMTLIEVILFGDINRDGVVDILDIVIVALSFDSSPGDTNWNATADLNNDAIINILDVFCVAMEYGKTAEIA